MQKYIQFHAGKLLFLLNSIVRKESSKYLLMNRVHLNSHGLQFREVEKQRKAGVGLSTAKVLWGICMGRGRKCIRKFCDGEITFILVKYYPNFSAVCQIYFVYVWNIMESSSL